jgi:hypothetical protein
VIARFLAWLFRAFPGRGSVLASLPKPTPELGPYRSGSITEGPSRLVVRTPPFDAAAARALAEMPPVCPKAVLDDATRLIRNAAIGGQRCVTLGSVESRENPVALARELKALGFTVRKDVIDRLTVSW